MIYYKKNNNSKLFSYFNDLSENKIKNMQNFVPIYSRFFSLNTNNYNAINLNHTHNIHSIKEIIDQNHYSIYTFSEKTKSKKASFFKFSPLLDTTKYMAGKYKDISRNIILNLPKVGESDKILKKIDCFDNAAYTDSFFSFLSSKLLNEHKFIHGIDFYGSFLGIKDKLKVDITDDLEYLYDYEFFHKNKNVLFETDKINEELINKEDYIYLNYKDAIKEKIYDSSISFERYKELYLSALTLKKPYSTIISAINSRFKTTLYADISEYIESK